MTHQFNRDTLTGKYAEGRNQTEAKANQPNQPTCSEVSDITQVARGEEPQL